MRKFQVLLLVATCWLAVGCASENIKSVGADRTIGVMVLRNPDPAKQPPTLIGYEAVTFENADETALFRALNQGSIIGGYGYFGETDLRTHCFRSNVCVLFNLLPGRYHVSYFNYGGVNGGDFYFVTGERVRKRPGSSIFRAMVGADEVTNIFNPDDIYFVIAPGSTGFAGSYVWSKDPKGPMADKIKRGTFAFERDAQGMDERAALQALMRDTDFTQNYSDWLPLVQRRLDRLSRPITPATPAPAPAIAPPPSKTKKPPHKD